MRLGGFDRCRIEIGDHHALSSGETVRFDDNRERKRAATNDRERRVERFCRFKTRGRHSVTRHQ